MSRPDTVSPDALPVCEFCGCYILEEGQRCPALSDGRCCRDRGDFRAFSALAPRFLEAAVGPVDGDDVDRDGAVSCDRSADVPDPNDSARIGDRFLDSEEHPPTETARTTGSQSPHPTRSQRDSAWDSGVTSTSPEWLRTTSYSAYSKMTRPVPFWKRSSRASGSMTSQISGCSSPGGTPFSSAITRTTSL